MTSLQPTRWHNAPFNTIHINIIKSADKMGMAPGGVEKFIGKDGVTPRMTLVSKNLCYKDRAANILQNHTLLYHLYTQSPTCLEIVIIFYLNFSLSSCILRSFS